MIGVEQLGAIATSVHIYQASTRVLGDPGSDIIHLAMNHYPAVIRAIVFVDFI